MVKRYLGQIFLYDPSILKRIIQVAQLSREDVVVEIGPGQGRLTRMLAERVRKVIAIELDKRLFEELKTELADYKNMEFIHGDALKYPYESLPEFKVVANIPYYITTPIIFRLLKVRKNLRSMTFTVQKEVAERIAAAPGGRDYGVLSLMVQYYAEPRLKFIISKRSFRPMPRVDSAVLHIKILERPSVSVKDEELFFKVIKTSFSQRRKMLSNSLKSLREDIRDRLIQAGIDPERRPETLGIEEFARLSDILSSLF
ncbi:MAG TPA: 16S rRNA (adenine(1518)-N(6)/adenine(1519)-N(6))-dimethyltransferase RsmA [Thermodesulfovibrionales bacterium]|nr:16S rRNA (adenine(1518)-N(6)/adenine(1519)-N(6))-dimethyltransferase RsmA [Thermodesulfovibrionales bacterium]